ncbi:MAG TPA: 4'-phosphopantetheinyl transferase superfamily protein, partial [Chitinolyticbacter sp.]|nr:4'-phosphopantetheinyl transferase superfamily protein [Chitinolyticbacter sp.]
NGWRGLGAKAFPPERVDESRRDRVRAARASARTRRSVSRAMQEDRRNLAPIEYHARMWTLNPLRSPAADVALWRLDLDHATPWHIDYLQDLSDDEATRALRYVRAADRLRFVATRLSLRRLLGERLGRTPRAVTFEQGPHGKPALARSGLQFNVSHTGNHALIAISTGLPVGVDIEQIKPARDTISLADKIYARAEQAWLKAQHDEVAGFYTVWSCKEAVLKAWGCGIAGHMARLSVVPENDGQVTLTFDETPQRDTHAWLLPVPEGYSAALACGPARSPF